MSFKRILIVDDEPIILELVEAIIESCTQEGIEITTAVNGKVALTKIKDSENRGESFDIIISDCNMLEMGGIDLCRQVMGEKKDVSPVFVLMSGKDYEEKASDVGADHFFLKGGTDFFDNLESLFKQP